PALSALFPYTTLFRSQNFALALVLSVILPMGLAAVVGWLSFYHKSTPLYASVISLVVPIVLTQAIFAGGSFTGSSSGLVGYPVRSEEHTSELQSREKL